jgi:spore coat polysaccharide biosynthesis protein SpsF
MKIGAIIQARTSSSRLPNKVLKTLPYGSNISILQQVIRRVKKSQLINEIIVATTTEKSDIKIIEIANKEDVKYFKGSLTNVLERYYFSAKENSLDLIVRVTSDCPCIDPEIIDLVVNEHLKNNNDYTSNIFKRTFPHGVDTEVFSFKSLEEAYFNAKENFEKEHVTPYIHRTNKNKYKIGHIEASEKYYAPDIRITVDTEEDYALLSVIYDYLFEKDNFFGTKDIISLFKDKPYLKLINKKIIQKKIFNNLEEEIEEAIKILDLQDLKRVVSYLQNIK